MVNGVMTLNVATNLFAREGALRSPTSSGGGSPVSSCPSSASQFHGQSVVAAFSPRESKCGSPVAGARAYAATEESPRARFSPGAVTKNLYDLLGVSKAATPREIKAAYRMAARRLHPDVVPEDQRLEATKAFLEVQETYSILSNDQSRAAYDLSLSMYSFQSSGFRNRGPVSYSGKEEIAFSTPAWGFSSPSVNSSSSSYPSSSFSFKGQNWETDQCW
ncbi:hypothetical protein M758_1G198500 [Ceratodon purpureus]|nr:hypothetical protein M758_1G198500 [Ceratodon purpureus]